MNTKYPIILVHGIAIKDFLFIKSFGKIDSILKKEGYKVYKSRIDGFGTIEHNAETLKNEILHILEEEKTDKVNIIAHSKGGLDSKYMILNLGMEDKVASLTTLCTPHKGSPVASSILKLPRWGLRWIAFWLNFWYRIFGDKKPDSLTVCKELAESKDIEDETFEITNKIYCQSYSTHMEHAKDDFVMGIPLIFFHHYLEEENCDGLVKEDSSIFGEYKGRAFDDSVSHSEIIDFLVNKKKKERIYSFYKEICNDLVKRGY